MVILGYSRESGSHPGILENLSGKSKKPQGWGNPCRPAGRMAMAATALGDGQVGFRSNWKKNVGLAPRCVRKTEAEGAEALASRVHTPHGSQSGTATRSARGSGVRDRGARGTTSSPALTSRLQPCGRLSPLFRRALLNGSVLPGIRSDGARSLARSLAHSDLGRRA